MSAIQLPGVFTLPTEPLSVTEHVIRYLAGSDTFGEPPLPELEEEQVITPQFDVEVRPHRYLITMRLPLFRHDEVAVAVSSNEVLIYGRRTVAEDDSTTESSNSVSQTFSKSFRLPNWISLTTADATFHDGILQVTFLRTVQPGLRFVHIRGGAS